MATHDVRNLLKLNLLLDKACLVLRQLFQKSWKMKFGHAWSGTEDDIGMMSAQLQMKNIGKLQHEAILTGELHSWDLTTLQVILTSTDFLNLTAKEVWNINYLTNIQNKVANSASKGITDDEFNSHWCAAVVTLVEFGESEADLELLNKEGRDGVEIIGKEKPVNDESTSEAHRLKEAGNVQFKQQNWSESIKLCTEAILLPGLPPADLATLYSNRSVAFLRQDEMGHAMEDAKKTAELRPEWWRGYYRMGQVHTKMNNYQKADGCFNEAFVMEPRQGEIIEARSYARMKQGQLDRNDENDQRLAHKSLDNIISNFERLTGSQVDAETIRSMLFAEFDDPILQNLQDCMKGKNFLLGVDGFPCDYGAAAQHFKKAADRGCDMGLLELALLTMEGKGVIRDMKLGIRMLREVAEKPPLLNGVPNDEVAYAEHALGLCYQDGIEVSRELVQESQRTRQPSCCK